VFARENLAAVKSGAISIRRPEIGVTVRAVVALIKNKKVIIDANDLAKPRITVNRVH
jgi:hypothetical protein